MTNILFWPCWLHKVLQVTTTLPTYWEGWGSWALWLVYAIFGHFMCSVCLDGALVVHLCLVGPKPALHLRFRWRRRLQTPCLGHATRLILFHGSTVWGDRMLAAVMNEKTSEAESPVSRSIITTVSRPG